MSPTSTEYIQVLQTHLTRSLQSSVARATIQPSVAMATTPSSVAMVEDLNFNSYYGLYTHGYVWLSHLLDSPHMKPVFRLCCSNSWATSRPQPWAILFTRLYVSLSRAFDLITTGNSSLPPSRRGVDAQRMQCERSHTHTHTHYCDPLNTYTAYNGNQVIRTMR